MATAASAAAALGGAARRLGRAGPTATLALALGCGGGGRPLPERVEFNRHVRPILAGKCYACHGPDAKQREAELRFDRREDALRDREGRAAIVPGDPRASELVRRIRSDDPDLRMPPPHARHGLDERERVLLERWIEQGARYEPHWSFRALERPVAPEVGDAGWVANPIDRFVLAGLEREGLAPAPAADPITLVRRLHLDLVGLPPEPEVARAWAADPSPERYARLVDALLASPHYGERMALHWLDLVRYADTNGYHADQHRNIHPYRDYVIRAFHGDKPFDRFTLEQLAGDLLPDAGLEARVASGYNRLNMVTTEDGAQPGEYLAKYAADRVRTTASVWLGVTLGCAECHDHKFDPLTARDFYGFSAFFADLDEHGRYLSTSLELPPEIPVPNAEEQRELERLATRIDALRAERAARVAELGPAFRAGQRRFERELLRNAAARQRPTPAFDPGAWSLPDPDGGEPGPGAGAVLAGDAGLRRVLPRPDASFEIALGLAELRLSGLDDRISVGVEPLGDPERRLELQLRLVEDDLLLESLPLAGVARSRRSERLGPAAEVSTLRLALRFIDARRSWRILFATGPGEPLREISEGAVVAGESPATEWAVELRAAAARGAPRGSARVTHFGAAAHALRLGDLPAPLAEAVALEPARRSAEQEQAIAEFYAALAPELAAWNAPLDALLALRDRFEEALPTTLVSAATTPRTTRVLPRGDWMDASGEVVTPAPPAFLPPLRPEWPADRRGLARWLTAPENPLTARATANRLVKLSFGRGIARTLDDLGANGEWPTHPALLDWLAVELVESGWSLKHVLRLLVTSNAYRQSSRVDPALARRDPANRLLGRQERFRLDAELVRDAALAVSGLLDRTLFGPSVKPHQPPGYWGDSNGFFSGPTPATAWVASSDGDRYRRGLYTYWKRTFPHPSLLAFDAPSREECTAERGRSSSPLQALVLLNDPSYVEAARVFAARIVREGGASFDERLGYAFGRALSREPQPEVRDVLRRLYEDHHRRFGRLTNRAQAIVRTGAAPLARDVPLAELAAWTSVARVVLNLHGVYERS